MLIDDWARRWGIPLIAIMDLKLRMGLLNTDPKPIVGESEAAIQAKIRLEATKKGWRVWRNNVGALYDADGGFIRFGLANDSKAMNDRIKSPDLIGIRPLVITSDMIGRTIGQFIGLEVKHSQWKFTGNKHELAQLKFLELINGLGGYGKFINNTGGLDEKL